MSTASELIIKAISEGKFNQNEMTSIVNAVNSKQRWMRAERAAVVATQIQVGTKVIIRNISPKYLKGIQGEVVNVTVGRSKLYATVRVTRSFTHKKQVGDLISGIPFACLEVIGQGIQPEPVEENPLLTFLGGK
jgi:hypothetical protein